MKYLFNLKKLLFTLMVVSSISLVSAKEYAYQGKVEGMACAFCVYNVSNKIREIAEIKNDSVNVELKTGKVEFISSRLIDKKELDKIFKDSGFSLTQLKQSDMNQLSNIEFLDVAQIVINFPRNQLNQVNKLLNSLGDLAENEMSLLIIYATKKDQLELLKALIAGRQQTIKVTFIEPHDNNISIKLYSMSTTDSRH